MKKLLSILSLLLLLSGCSNLLNETTFSSFLKTSTYNTYSQDNWELSFSYPTKNKIERTELETVNEEVAHLDYHNGLLSAFEIIVLPIETTSSEKLLTETENLSFYLVPHNIPSEVEEFIVSTFNASESSDELEESTES